MVQITKESGMQSAAIPFAWVEVQYPDKAQWDEDGFYDMVEQHVAALREQYRDYVRADVFGQNPYFRFFRKFKKTFPVMMQFESMLLKGREFPKSNAVTAVPFLAELETHVLTGTHDVEQLLGPAELNGGAVFAVDHALKVKNEGRQRQLAAFRRSPPAQPCVDVRPQHGQGEGLCDIVVRAGFQPGHLVDLQIVGGQ